MAFNSRFTTAIHALVVLAEEPDKLHRSEDGKGLRTVTHLIGHSTIQMTMRYSHLAPEHTHAAVDVPVSSGDTTTDTGKNAEW